MRNLVLITLLLASGAAFGQAPRKPIHFTLTEYNNILLPALLNGTDSLQLMFHTAASDMTLIEDAVKRLTTMRFSGTTDSIKSWGGSANSGRVSQHNRLSMGEFKWDDVVITENKFSGQYSDGKLGPNFFGHQVISIDFDKQELRVTPGLPADIGLYEKCKLVFEHDNLLIEAVCKVGTDTLHHRFLVHSGYAGALLLDDDFANRNHLSERLPITGTKEMKDSYGNIIKSRKTVVPAFSIGGLSLAQVPASFFEGSIGRQKISAMGGEILKRFNIVIDAERNYIYLKPNGLFGLAYGANG